MPSLRSLVVRRATTPQIEMGAATSSVTSITPMKNIPDNNHHHNHNHNHENENENDTKEKRKTIHVDNNKIDKFSGIRSPLLRNRSNDESSMNSISDNKNSTMRKKNSHVPLLRPESCASLETHGATSWVNLAPGGLRKCETAVGLSTLALEGRAINRSRVCSRCSSLLSLASSSRYSLAAGGNFVPANPTINDNNDDDDDDLDSRNNVVGDSRNNYSSSKSIYNGKFKCKLCLEDVEIGNITKIDSCGCSYCKDCMLQYAEFEINEGAYEISCPDAQCERDGIISLNEIKDLVSKELMEKHHRFRLNRDVSVDKGRAWCPSPGCETVCSIGKNQEVGGSISLGPVHCPSCSTEFCSLCREPWHIGKCPEIPSGIPIDNDRIKCCPMCSVPIEKDEGCAQMMCKRCKHVFCWYCLASLDDDFLLRHYDKGPCKNKLGHSRASVIWHRTQVIGIFAGFGLLLLVASPLLLLAAPCIVCCKCRVCGSSRLEQEEGGLPEDTGT